MSAEPVDQVEEPVDEVQAVEAVVVEAPRRRVAISAGPRAVEIEGPEPLEEIEAAVARMWRLTGDNQVPRLWSGGMGFCAEIAPQE